MALRPPPPPVKSEPGSFAWMDWYRSLYDFLISAGSIAWSTINFAGSNLTDIVTRLHSSLQSIQGGVPGEYYHLTAAQVAAVGADPALPKLQTPTIDSLTDWFNTSSSGQVSGGTISVTGTQIEVTAGEGMIKSGVAITDPTFLCEWAALPLTTVTDARVTWVCVDYNLGNPAILLLEGSSSTDFSEPAAINYNSCWPLGNVVREGSVVHMINNPRKMQDVTGSLIRRFRQTLPLARDERVGGLIIGETGTRNITLSAGYLFDRQNRFTITALDTSVTGSFDRYYGSTLDSAGATQWPNTQYNNAGVLTTMTNNRYANLYWYLELDDSLMMVYGNNEYPSAAGAEAETLPTTLPLRVNTQSRLIARSTFQKSAATFTAIDSSFTNTFAASAAATHNNLAGLQGGTAGEYYHLTSAQHTDLTDGGDSTLHYHASDRSLANTTGLGANVGTALAVAVGSAGAVVVNGGVLGTPSSGTLTNCTGLPATGVVGTAPVTKAADFTVAVDETWLINNKASACVVTLPAAASFTGRTLTFHNYQAFTLTSASSNVVPQGGGAAGTAILLAVVGNWATLVSDGTNWVIMQAAPNNILLLE